MESRTISSPIDIKKKREETSLKALNRHHSSSMDQYAMLEFCFTSRRCVLGILCMDAKSNGKPMQNIISRLKHYEDFEIFTFGEKTILEKPPEQWPKCDCMIAFFSKGFPLEKAFKYQELHPTTFSVNDLGMQKLLLDRREVYRLLVKNGIPTAKHVFVSRDNYEPSPLFYEENDYIEVNGFRLDKPFVEKPVSGEDHNIRIYYHSAQGGGSVHLFRKVRFSSPLLLIGKVNNKSSEKFPDENKVRREGSYIYEEYIATENAVDIKVYTVGDNFAHAEARKSPVVDGMVLRDKDGKEVRHKIELNAEEKMIAQKLVNVMKQQVCGFDLLRDSKNGKSYVCDVNGWSFVKGNQVVIDVVMTDFIKFYDDCALILRDIFLHAMVSKGLTILQPKENERELRGMVCLFRHADRTPKQKLKLKLTNKHVLSFFENPHREVKLKSDSHRQRLDKLLEIMVDLVNDPEKKFEGIEASDQQKLYLVITVLKGRFGGTKFQLKPIKHSIIDGKEVVTQALFVMKWGGILTHSGTAQARRLGQTFFQRVVPHGNTSSKKFDELSQNITVMSNNERRVKKTAEEFAMGFMGVEELPKDFVLDDKITSKLLGMIERGKTMIDKMKQELSSILHKEDVSEYALPGLEEIGNPLQTMKEIYALMKDFQDEERQMNGDLCEGETVRMMEQRWERLRKNFYNPQTQTFDISKLPDIFDYITYEVIHNQKAVGHDLYRLFQKSLLMARLIVPAEYGIQPQDKLIIGSLISEPLLKQIYKDLVEISHDHKSKLRFYFSSESHLHSLRNCLVHSDKTKFYQVKEPVMLNYLTHIAFKLYENVNVAMDAPNRFQIEVLFSSGTSDNPFGINDEHIQQVAPMISIHDHFSFKRFEQILQKVDEVAAEHAPPSKKDHLEDHHD